MYNVMQLLDEDKGLEPISHQINIQNNVVCPQNQPKKHPETNIIAGWCTKQNLWLVFEFEMGYFRCF